MVAYDDDDQFVADAVDDDFHSLGNSTDDYLQYKDNYNTAVSNDDGYDDQYFSAEYTTSWLDHLLNNTSASNQGTLTPVEDVNPDNVLASLVFNSIVCVILLGLYELLRRWIPSVYSQRLMYENERYTKSSSKKSKVKSGNGNGSNAMEAMEREFVKRSQMKASGNSLRGLRVTGSVMNEKVFEEIKEEGVETTASGDSSAIVTEAPTEVGGDGAKEDDENSLSNACTALQDDMCTTMQQSGTTLQHSLREGSYSWTCCRKTCAFPVLEWCIPVHNTPWSTFRHLAGLDAYFYLRYIRMCLKITAVSSFWAMVILCPVYATGGGNQIGFYHFSMANVLQEDKGRVWVPTFFCWAFTMYCWFCVREEMMHYLELRMEFLGGEEEERIMRRKYHQTLRESASRSREDLGGAGGYGAPSESGSLGATATENGQDANVAENCTNDGTTTENGRAIGLLGRDESELDVQRSRYISPLLANDAEATASTNTTMTPNNGLFSTAVATTTTAAATKVRQQMKQHRYSLQIEKVPVDLRSNTALFNYFSEMFPNQVHSACITMNVPDLDTLSARRQRVCRRLEKSLAYHSVTGARPTHIAGRPRFRCCGIESTPIDGLCVALCCFYKGPDSDEISETYPTEIYDNLPDKGECVDSILYYTLDLATCNRRMKTLQEEKFRIAETGSSTRCGAGIDDSNEDWYVKPLGMLKTNAAMAAEGLREEFEVSGEDDYLGDGVTPTKYGSVSISYNTSNMERRAPNSSARHGNAGDKRVRLVEEDHLNDSVSGADKCLRTVGSTVRDTDSVGSMSISISQPRRKKTRYHNSRTYAWLRAILWRMGVDFLAAGLDEVRNRTDVVVDHVSRPCMSSTGFVTFKTLTPVTVTTSAPLTYNRDPMSVSIAPEPRDLVWQNVQIDQDIVASREFAANVLLGLGVLLWSIPLTLIQAWAKIENVALIPGLEWVDKIGERWKPLINGYLPVITLLGLILLLPLIFQWVATSYEKRKTLSGVQNSIVGRYFFYQLANIYITVTAGALWTSLGKIIDHPQNLLVILGDSLPKLAGYFISLLITKTLAGLPMVLLRVGALSRMMFLRSCFNKKRLTQRELKEVYRKQPIYYGWEYPTQFLVIIICFTYACITPFVLPVGAIYYFVALLVYKKQALYVYTPTYESGGRMFPQAVSKTLFALLISQMTFIGYTLIRKGVFQIILLAPLPFLTVFFNLLVQRRYVEPSKKLSLERAVKIDALLDQSPEFSDEAYQQPVLTEKASVPVCDADDYILTEVIETLDRLQNETAPEP
eukprot:CAMPEP_0183746620 /NCGR_PEP_ID=MMETSP0737-20130205/66850_1 /TAXON_ID=385413 /ORGANISM="Thalassiosira miniscula, Strain CCMP1093" /LENGTH=1283 /DNA_ID=CAMNT_0025982321 /DNA_START=48 /DNA_END=3899 /DNA_ORIENTATION=+